MSKAERNPPREAPAPKPAPREPEIAPPLFWNANDDEAKRLSAPIHLVHVYALDKTGERVPLDCTTLDGLPTFPHELGPKYCASPLELVARDEKGAIVARVIHRVALGTAPAATPIQSPAPAPAMPPVGADFMSMILSMNERTDKLLGLLIQSKDTSHAQIIEAISRMSGARITDSQELFQTILKAKQAGGAPTGAGELAAFKSGMAFFEKLVDAGKEAEAGGGGGEDDVLTKLQEVARVFEKVTTPNVVNTTGVKQ